MEWGPYQQRILERADRNAVINALSGLKPNFANAQWIRNDNEFIDNVSKRVGKFLEGAKGLNDAPLLDYLAASAPLHAADGWAYLGCAVEAALRGSPDVARHLGYYAELRASMSLLSSHGVGVFAKHGVVVDAAGKFDVLWGMETHEMAWKALEGWAATPVCADSLGKTLSADGKRFSDWLSEFPVTAAPTTISFSWLSQWGLDIKRMSRDRDARNIASYNPTGIKPKKFTVPRETIKLVNHVWRACEPQSAAPFQLLDKHLIRLALEANYKAVTDNTAQADAANYRAHIEKMLTALDYSDELVAPMADFFTRKTQPEDLKAIQLARQDSPVIAPEQHLETISRALLLLRVATGSAAQCLTRASVTRAHLRFWWEGYGERAGLWESGKAPADFLELWPPVQEAMNSMSDWLGLQPASPLPSLHTVRANQSNTIRELSSFERIPLWGLGL